MESFEHIVGLYLQEENYWIRHSVKINLSPKEKRSLGKNQGSIPRPEIDIVAYNRAKDEMILIEVKSYLDSDGVKINDLKGTSKNKGRYRLLNRPKYQNLVTTALQKDWLQKGLITNKTTIRYGLAAGKVQQISKKPVENYLKRNGYYFFSPEKIRKAIQKLAASDYFDDIVIMVSKLTDPNHD